MNLAPSPPAQAPLPPALYRAGSRIYTLGQLRAVFAWLLMGEVVFTLIDNIEPKVLSVILKSHGATDTQIGVIIGSFNAILQLLIMPPLGYYSDRLRTRWGRRIPILFLVTPFATLFLAITPFAPEIAARLLHIHGLGSWMETLSITPVVLTFALLVFLYRSVQTATNVMFFGLLRDVVPDTHMGRFLALFRLLGAGGTFAITYWLLGYANTQSKPIFIGVALLNLFGFFAICCFVREGTYPPVDDIATRERTDTAPRLRRMWLGLRTFVSESFRHPVYLWLYFVRVCMYGALLGLSQFLIFFPQYELGLPLAEIGKMMSWPSLAWIALAYPIGQMTDRHGAQPVLRIGLIGITLAYVLSFFCVIGPKTYLVSAMATGLGFWVVMLAQLKLTQEIFHPQRYSQIAGAATIVQSIVIAIFISPVCGRIFDLLKGWHHTLVLPLAGNVELGPYRLVNLMMGLLYGMAWFGLVKLRQHWIAHGGPRAYQAPL